MAVLLGCEEPVLSAVAALSAGSGGGGGGIWWMAANASASSAGCVGGGGSDARARARAIHASFMHGWPAYGNGVGDGGTSAGAGAGTGAGAGAGAGAEIAISDHLAAALAFALWDRVRRGVPLPGPWAAAAAVASSATANANSNTDANAANASDQHAFCQQHCLNHSGLRDMARLRSRFRSVLASAGLVRSNSSRDGASSSPDLPPASLVLYSLAFGFSPHVARVARGVWKGVNSGKKGPGGGRGGCKRGDNRILVTVRGLRGWAGGEDHQSQIQPLPQAATPPPLPLDGSDLEAHLHSSSLAAETIQALILYHSGRGQGTEGAGGKWCWPGTGVAAGAKARALGGVHKKSPIPRPLSPPPPLPLFLAYHSSLHSSRLYLLDISLLPSQTMVILAGNEVRATRDGKGVVVDGWVSFKSSELHAALMLRVKGEIEDLLREILMRPLSIRVGGEEEIEQIKRRSEVFRRVLLALL